MQQTYTLTFGNRAENHKGMQIIGNKLDHGLTHDDLIEIRDGFDNEGYETELINLNNLLNTSDNDGDDDDTYGVGETAELLIVRKGLDRFVNTADLFKEQKLLKKDTKAFMYGRVVNKKARYNLCFSDFSQEADYPNKKGTVYNFTSVKTLNRLRSKIGQLNPLLKNLQCEGNYYYDVNNTFIGFHGDTEREIVVACRLGADFPLYFQWYKNNTTHGDLLKRVLNHGDMYFMSDKAVGRDWKKSSIYTLRHAAGLEKNVGLGG